MKSSFAAGISCEDDEDMTQTRESSAEISDTRELKRDLKQLQLTDFFKRARLRARGIEDKKRGNATRSAVLSLCNDFSKISFHESSSEVLKFITKSLLATQEATLFSLDDIERLVRKLNSLQGSDCFKTS